MKSQELRASFVDYFVGQGHKHLALGVAHPATRCRRRSSRSPGWSSSSRSFSGEEPAPAPRVVTVQRCLRVAGAKSDIENVGRTGRHGTFLEMLGNFSFGDYYKREAIGFAWEFVTQRLGLDPQKLYVTVHTGDDEAQQLWERRDRPAAPSRITRFDEDNFWTMGPTGPCGPCTEIFYDTGPENASGPDDDRSRTTATATSRFGTSSSNSTIAAPTERSPTCRARRSIPAPGFERMLAVANGGLDVRDRPVHRSDRGAAAGRRRRTLAPGEQLVRRRIIADHARAVTFLIADGVYPSNTDRGYVLRFLIRRAIRNGRLLGYPREFMPQLAGAVVTSLEPGYPELRHALERRAECAALRKKSNFVTHARSRQRDARPPDRRSDRRLHDAPRRRRRLHAARHLWLSVGADARDRGANAASPSTRPASTSRWKSSVRARARDAAAKRAVVDRRRSAGRRERVHRI